MDSFAGLITLRALMGVFEAACQPTFVVLSGTWYKREEQASRINFWYVILRLASYKDRILQGILLTLIQVHDEWTTKHHRWPTRFWILIRTRQLSNQVVAGSLHELRNHHSPVGHLRILLAA